MSLLQLNSVACINNSLAPAEQKHCWCREPVRGIKALEEEALLYLVNEVHVLERVKTLHRGLEDLWNLLFLQCLNIPSLAEINFKERSVNQLHDSMALSTCNTSLLVHVPFVICISSAPPLTEHRKGANCDNPLQIYTNGICASLPFTKCWLANNAKLLTSSNLLSIIFSTGCHSSEDTSANRWMR